MSKLYKVTLRGMTTSSVGAPHGIAYVVAEDSAEAHQKIKHGLEERNLGTDKERELHTVELLADSASYPNCGRRLYE